MKRNILSTAIAVFVLISSILVCAGCSGGGAEQPGGIQGGVFAQPGLNVPEQQGGPSQTVQTQPAAGGTFIGSWVHTYEYLGSTYRTTLVINSDGSAVYYNEEAELGNFSGRWYSNGGGIVISRSDGLNSQCRIEGDILIELSEENGQYYEAQYRRA